MAASNRSPKAASRTDVWTLRRVLVFGILVSTILPLGVGSAAVWFWLMPSLRSQAMDVNTAIAQSLAGQVQYFLSQPQQILMAGAKYFDDQQSGANTDASLQLIRRANPVFFATYLADHEKRIRHVALDPALTVPSRDLVGLDMSAQQLFRRDHEAGKVYWSNAAISPLSATPAIVAAIKVNTGVLAGEISLARLSDFVKQASTRKNSHIIIADSRGQILAHPDVQEALRLVNVSHIPLIRAAAQSGQSTGVYEYEGIEYLGTALRVNPQDWVVLVGQPVGQALRTGWQTLYAISIAAFATAGIALLLGYAMARWLGERTEQLAEAATQAAAGATDIAWPDMPVKEYDQFAESLRRLMGTVRQREAALREANLSLESKVMERTQALTTANAELSATLSHLTKTREELSRSERLAAIGRLLAGMAHELNTPIGNGLLATTTLETLVERFSAQMEQGLRRSELTTFVDETREASSLLGRSLFRASDLIHTFKQLAVNQATSERRRFQLTEIMQEVAVVMSPQLESRNGKLTIGRLPKIELDSFAGLLEQVVCNLIENALAHGYAGEGGEITLNASLDGTEQVSIRVSDNGVGIEPAVLPRIFDPFFSTKLGKGGSGLGLHIAHMLVSDMLGGSISVTSELGKGTTFTVTIPVMAPANLELAEI